MEGQSNVDSIKNLSWKEFEYLIGEAFRRQGYSIEESLRGGADGGVDLVLRTNNQRIFVQCKNWKTSTIGVTVVRELFGVVKAEGAYGGMVVCSGGFMKEAVEFAKKTGIRLIDGDELCGMIAGVQMSGLIQPSQCNPICPRCGAEMVQRVARKGRDVGTSFWVVPDIRNAGELFKVAKSSCPPPFGEFSSIHPSQILSTSNPSYKRVTES